MAALKSGDMGSTKTAGSGAYTGKTRDAIFLLKLKEKQNKTGGSFIIGASASGKKVIGVKYAAPPKREFTYKEIGKDKKEITVPYTSVFKDPDFGGGKGSGGGAEETKVTESMQCFYNSYIFNTTGRVRRGDPLLKEPPTDEELLLTADYCNTTHSLTHCLLKRPEKWIEDRVFCKTANKLYADWHSKFNGKVWFHRGGKGTGKGSAFMDNIYIAKSECLKNDKKSQPPQAPGSFSHDKWNPGDIWMTTLAPGAKPLEKFTKNWSTLNAEVERLASGPVATVLGISLKKLNTAKIKEFNKKGLGKDSQKFVNYRFGAGDFFNSKDVYLEPATGQMQLRTFGEPWQGQIGGSSAAGGKIGGGNIDYYLKQIFNKNIFSTTGENGMKSECVNQYERTIKDEMWKLYHLCVFGKTPEKKLDGKTTISKVPGWVKQSKIHANNPKEAEKFEKLLDAKDANWIYSKYMCLKTLEVLMSGSDAQRNEFMTAAWLYASSNTDQSSFFIKISD